MNLPTELLEQIRAAIADGSLQLGDPGGRTPLRPRQLHDLRLLPTATDARPTFCWSAEGPRDNPESFKTHPYPKLLWNGITGEEITVRSGNEESEKIANGYVTVAPSDVVLDPIAEMRAALDALPEEDRKLILDGQRKQRNQEIASKLAALSDVQLESVLASAVEPKKKKSA